MEFTKEVNFKKVFNTVFDKLKTDDEADYDKVEHDKNAEEAVEAAMKETYDDTIKMIENAKNANSLEEALAHLSPLRQELIKSAFRCQSFHVDIKRQTDGTVNLLFESISGSKLSFLPSIVTLDESNFKENDGILIARIVFEIIVLCLSFIGTTGQFSDTVVAEALKIITASIVSVDRVLGDIKQLIAHAKGGQKHLIGNDVVAIIIDIFAIVGSPIIRVFKLLIQNLSWLSIIIIICQALCFIAITVLSGGAAVIAKILSWLLHAAYFVQKLIQKNEFDAITFPKK